MKQLKIGESFRLCFCSFGRGFKFIHLMAQNWKLPTVPVEQLR